MKRNGSVSAFLFAFCSTLLFAQQQDHSKGIRPRDRPEEYAVHARNQGFTIAATALSPNEVKHLFAYDISRNYVVFEVACYPESNGKLQLEADNFVVKTGDKGELAYRADSQTVAAVIQQKNTPKPASQTIYTEANIGYESGTDPYTGRRVHDVYTGAGVGVSNYPAPQYPTPGGYPQDRDLLEGQLWNRSLPEGSFTAPVAGYLYFPSSLLKKKTNGAYVLEYQGSDSSSKVDLSVPLKTK